MAEYMVERYVPGMPPSELWQHLTRVRETARLMRAEGTDVRLVHSALVPGDEACVCLFTGASHEAVMEANERAGAPYDRIVTVLTPPDEPAV